MHKPRKLEDVIDQMLPLLRLGGADIAGLEHIRYMAGYTAPEAMPQRWSEAAEWLNSNAPPTHPAYRELIAIFAGEPNA